MHTLVIPEQFTGKKNDLFYERPCEDSAQAAFVFLRGCERLLYPGQWHLWAGAAPACFELTNPEGEILNRPLQTGDYIRIDIPGPGSIEGKGYDWVLVEIVDDQRDKKEGTYFNGH